MNKQFLSIKQLKKRSGMTNKELSQVTGVPVRTIEGWSSGRTAPADYVIELIEYKLINEGYINPLRFFVADLDSDSVKLVIDKNDNAVIIDDSFFSYEEITADTLCELIEKKSRLHECRSFQEISELLGAELKIQTLSEISDKIIKITEI